MKEGILKAVREKQLITYKGSSTRLSADFLAETLEARDGGLIYSNVKEKKINEEFYIWENCFSKGREKLKHSQINKKVVCAHYDHPSKNAQGSPAR